MRPTNNTKISNNFDQIDILRGIAALMVVLSHISGILSTMGPIQPVFEIFLEYGFLGVDIFFVISGFIITHSLAVSNYKLELFPKFLLKRIIRIEPSYLLSVAFVLMLQYVVTLSPLYQGIPFNIDFRQVLFHLAYLPTHFGYNWLNPVYWSLEAEFHFYILVGLFYPIIFRNKNTLVSFFLIASCFTYFVDFSVFQHSVLFVFGIASAAFKHQRISITEYIVLLVINILIALFLNFDSTKLIVGALTAFIIIQESFSIRNSFMKFLGLISYSLYLIHMPLATKLIRVLKLMFTEYNQIIIVFTLTLFTCIIVSYLFYLLIEKPTQKLSKSVSYKMKTE